MPEPTSIQRAKEIVDAAGSVAVLTGAGISAESGVTTFRGQDGLCHVSELADKFVKNVEDICKVGDELTVKVIDIDNQGRVKLSRKAAMKENNAGKQS